jgi:nitrogen fixation-related uncharacterized protein
MPKDSMEGIKMSGLYWIIPAAILYFALCTFLWALMKTASNADDAAEKWERER